MNLSSTKPAFSTMTEKNLSRVSRIAAITDGDLVDRSATPLFREAMKQEIYWSPVFVAETSEPRVTLTVRLPVSGLVFGVINLKSLLNFDSGIQAEL